MSTGENVSVGAPCGGGKWLTGLREHPGVDGALGGRGVPQGRHLNFSGKYPAICYN